MREAFDSYLSSLMSDIEAFCGEREWERARTIAFRVESVVEFATILNIITEPEADAKLAELGDYLDAVGCPSE